MNQETRSVRIERILRDALTPQALEIKDDSARHAGHAGRMGLGADGETHFTILVRSARFAGLSRVARHRLVQELLAGEFGTGLHALSLVLEEAK